MATGSPTRSVVAGGKPQSRSNQNGRADSSDSGNSLIIPPRRRKQLYAPVLSPSPAGSGNRSPSTTVGRAPVTHGSGMTTTSKPISAILTRAGKKVVLNKLMDY